MTLKRVLLWNVLPVILAISGAGVLIEVFGLHWSWGTAWVFIVANISGYIETDFR